MCPLSVQNVSNMLDTLWTYFGHIFTNQVIVQNMSINVSKSWTHFGHILDKVWTYFGLICQKRICDNLA